MVTLAVWGAVHNPGLSYLLDISLRNLSDSTLSYKTGLGVFNGGLGVLGFGVFLWTPPPPPPHTPVGEKCYFHFFTIYINVR